MQGDRIARPPITHFSHPVAPLTSSLHYLYVWTWWNRPRPLDPHCCTPQQVGAARRMLGMRHNCGGSVWRPAVIGEGLADCSEFVNLDATGEYLSCQECGSRFYARGWRFVRPGRRDP